MLHRVYIGQREVSNGLLLPDQQVALGRLRLLGSTYGDLEILNLLYQPQHDIQVRKRIGQ